MISSLQIATLCLVLDMAAATRFRWAGCRLAGRAWHTAHPQATNVSTGVLSVQGQRCERDFWQGPSSTPLSIHLLWGNNAGVGFKTKTT